MYRRTILFLSLLLIGSSHVAHGMAGKPPIEICDTMIWYFECPGDPGQWYECDAERCCVEQRTARATSSEKNSCYYVDNCDLLADVVCD